MRLIGNLNQAETFFALLLILNGNSAFHTNEGFAFIIDCFMYGALFLLWALSKNDYKCISINLWLTLFLPFLVVIFFIHNSLNITKGFLLFGIGMPILSDYFSLCFRENRNYNLLLKISDLIFLFSLISLFFWVFGSFANIIQTNCEIVGECGIINKYPGYYWLHFNAQPEDGTLLPGEVIYRNSSIFAEAPMFNLWLMFSLTIDMFIRENKHMFRIVIFILCILTSMSTTGIVYILIILFVFFSEQSHKTTKRKGILKIIKFAKYPFLIILAYFMYYSISDLLELKGESGSSVRRLFDIAVGFDIFFKNPFWGIGYNQTMGNLFGTSNTFASMLAQCGLYLCTIIYFPVIMAFLRAIKKIDYTTIALFVFYSYAIYSTVMYYNLFYVLIPSIYYGKMFQVKKRTTSNLVRTNVLDN